MYNDLILHPIDVKVNMFFTIVLKYKNKGDVVMNRIRDLRENKNLSQAEIAKVIKTSQQHYSKIESGKADIYGEKLKLLAEFYNVSILVISVYCALGAHGWKHGQRARAKPDFSQNQWVRTNL